MFKDKTLLITGGTGSFGNAVLKRFLDTDIKEIRVFSRDEKKQDDMRNLYHNDKLKFFIGDTRDYNSIYQAMHGVDYVFQAAALKQVPSCEFFPLEAVKTNVVGTENVLTAAMCSRGSVIPLFIDQIKANHPITITDPNMTRFMMSLDSAVDLVLFAFEHSKGGELFIQKAPAATIQTLAEAVCELFGNKQEPHIIGTRHGEKLYESLLTREEMVRAVDFGDYYVVPSDNRDLNYSKYFSKGQVEFSEAQDYTSHNTRRLNKEEMKEMLLSLDYVKEQLSMESRV